MADPIPLRPGISTGGNSSTSSGGGPTFPEMEARVKALEDKFEKIDTKLDGIARDTAEVKGRVANMPSTWQVLGICTGMIALAITGGATVLAFARMLATNN